MEKGAPPLGREGRKAAPKNTSPLKSTIRRKRRCEKRETLPQRIASDIILT